MNRKAQIIILFALTLLSFFAAHSSYASWTIEVVDAPKYFGHSYYPLSLAVDKNNNPHMTYGGDHLYYAYHNGIVWNYDTVDLSPGVGINASIAIDLSGNVHIAYYDSVNKDLKYASNTSSKWIIETLDSEGDVGRDIAIAVDSSGKTHISYKDITNRDLKYATNKPGQWIKEIVDDEGYYYIKTSLAVDSSGNAHISYFTDDLKYATNKSGNWVTEIVDSDLDIYSFNSIALDTSGKAHIIYRNSSGLTYANNVAGHWSLQTLDTVNHSMFVSIDIDSANRAHISYHVQYDYYNGELKYATNTSGAWTFQNVDASGKVGLYSSLAVDSSDKVHIGYFDFTNQTLKYASNSSGGWLLSTVDKSGLVGKPSMTLDSKNNIHITYSGPDRTLLHTTNKTGEWIPTTVDSIGGRNPFIAIDGSDNIHISYQDRDQNDLKYATNSSGVWFTQTLVAGVSAGRHSAIAVDGSEKVHIVYTEYYSYFCSFPECPPHYSLNYISSTEPWINKKLEGVVGWSGLYSFMAVDASGGVHISYRDISDNPLKYATNESGQWVVETIGNALYGSGSSLALDLSGKAHISYYDSFNKIVKYATNETGQWIVETVGNRKKAVYGPTSIGIDSSGTVHIIYYDKTNSDLIYATNSTGQWGKETIVCGLGGNSYPYSYPYTSGSLTIDSTDTVHVSFDNSRVKDLFYARKDNEGGIVAPIHQHTYSNESIFEPIISSIPSCARPIGVGSVVYEGDFLNVQIALDNFSEPVDIYGAYILSTDLGQVNVLSPDLTFQTLPREEILQALETGNLPEEVEPWKLNVTGEINENPFIIPVSDLQSGKYFLYLLVAPAGNIISYYLWETYFRIP